MYPRPLFQYKPLAPNDEETHFLILSKSPRHSICYFLPVTLFNKLCFYFLCSHLISTLHKAKDPLRWSCWAPLGSSDPTYCIISMLALSSGSQNGCFSSSHHTYIQDRKKRGIQVSSVSFIRKRQKAFSRNPQYIST